jgi:hypothetical protein
MSDDGTKIAFATQGPLVPGDSNPWFDVYLRDLAAGTTELISRSPTNAAANNSSGDCVNLPSVDVDGSGSAVAFSSYASNLTGAPDDAFSDAFVSRPLPADGDGDGIADGIDTIPGTFSNDFSDGTTYGQIKNRNGLAVSVRDSIAATGGVRVTIPGTGPNKANLSICGIAVKAGPGTNADFKCGSVIVTVDPGSAPIEVVIGPDLAIVTIPAGVEAEVDQTPSGAFTVENVIGGAVTVDVDGTTTTVPAGGSLAGNAWDFTGFLSPVDNDGVLNAAAAGKAIPIRWQLLDVGGAPVTNLSTASLSVRALACPGTSTADQVEEYTTGATGLLNLGNGSYQLNWQTPKGYAGSCKTLVLDIGDGVVHTALFRFAK